MKKISDPKPVGSILEGLPLAKERLSKPTRAQQRLIEASLTDDLGETLYQHSALCQTYLPHRDQGERREWLRENGNIQLEVTAGNVTDPHTRQRVFVGLPCGPKARLVLMSINQRAVLTQSPVVEAEENVTRFVGRALKLDTGGRTIKSVKDQLSRLAACNMSIIGFKDDRAVEMKSPIVEAFDIWARDERQRTLWPSLIRLSPRYFESLQRHAVPLSEAHISYLSGSSLALDVYAWLAQRLHRVKPGKPCTVYWSQLHAQFGGPKLLTHFRADFLTALNQVRPLYREAKLDVTREGVKLHHSNPVVMPLASIVVPSLGP